LFIYKGVRFHWSIRKFLVNLLILSVFLSIFVFYISKAVKASAEVKTVAVIVHRGDTLWSIAKTFASGSDPREVIFTIKSLNHLKDSSLVAGQKLKLGYMQ
jgi:LysM repeat protein